MRAHLPPAPVVLIGGGVMFLATLAGVGVALVADRVLGRLLEGAGR